MNEQHAAPAPNAVGTRLVKYAESTTGRNRQIKRFHERKNDFGSREATSAGALTVDKVDERTECCEGRPIDLVIGNHEIEALFKRRQHGRHGHRIELRDCAQQRRVSYEIVGSLFKPEHVPQYRIHMNTILLHQLVLASADRSPASTALKSGGTTVDYQTLSTSIERFAGAMVALGLSANDRVAVFLEKRAEMVIACFGAACGGAVFVPINPVLKREQVAHILSDCNARLLVTSEERFRVLGDAISACPDLRHVIVVDGRPDAGNFPFSIVDWGAVNATPNNTSRRRIDSDMAAILYTSGSTGRPKGVVLSHRNMVAGAKSVAEYLGNHAEDRLLAALPLSFDAGFSQLTTAFHVGASVMLLNYLLPIDVIKAVARERVTGLTAVPPLWIQLCQQKWPEGVTQHLRYIANTGGRMPLETLQTLRRILPKTKPFLMYGLTEAFRSTYLPPEEVELGDRQVENALEFADASPGLLGLAPSLLGLPPQLVAAAERLVEETPALDGEGFLYFIGRRDEMIKTSGYRVSPTEIEEVIYALPGVAECAAFGVAHQSLGEAIVVVAMAKTGELLEASVIVDECRSRLPAYMVPSDVRVGSDSLPRNPNGKIDRRALAEKYAHSATNAET